MPACHGASPQLCPKDQAYFNSLPGTRLQDRARAGARLRSGFVAAPFQRIPCSPVRGEVLGGGLEPPCLSAYAPQTYVSAISPPEREGRNVESGRAESKSRPRLLILVLVLVLVLEEFAAGSGTCI